MQVQVKIATIFLFLFSSTACQADGGVQARARATRDKPKPAPSMLIYSDQSPGALPHALAWQGAAELRGENAVLVTESAEFVTQLSRHPWSWVVVTCRYASTKPYYTEALRAYAEQYPRSIIEIFLWHDNGTDPTPDTAVAATMSNFLWNHGMTTISYINAGAKTEPEARKTRTVPGYHLPDFEGIGIEDPAVLARVPAERASRLSIPGLIKVVISILQTDDCRAECWKTYTEELDICNSQHDTQLQQCYDLYGPGSSDPDPDKLAQCVKDANNTHTACVEGAAQRYNNCVALCPEEAELEKSPTT